MRVGISNSVCEKTTTEKQEKDSYKKSLLLRHIGLFVSIGSYIMSSKMTLPDIGMSFLFQHTSNGPIIY